MDFVDNQLNPRSGTIRGRAIVENKNNFLAPGLFARMQLFGGEIDALLVSDASIVSDQTRKIVFVVGADNKVGAKPVVLGPLAHGLRVIKSGLKPDDRIVIDGIANPAVRPGGTGYAATRRRDQTSRQQVTSLILVAGFRVPGLT